MRIVDNANENSVHLQLIQFTTYHSFSLIHSFVSIDCHLILLKHREYDYDLRHSLSVPRTLTEETYVDNNYNIVQQGAVEMGYVQDAKKTEKRYTIQPREEIEAFRGR